MSQQVDAQPYAWPYDGPVVPRRTALLVCADGDAISQIAGETERQLADTVEAARDAGITVIASAAADAAAQLAERCEADMYVERPAFGGFTDTPLESVLRTHGWSDLVLIGFPFELGADCTMREANDLGFECLAIEDCGSGLSPSTLAGALDSIRCPAGYLGRPPRQRPCSRHCGPADGNDTERSES